MYCQLAQLLTYQTRQRVCGQAIEFKQDVIPKCIELMIIIVNRRVVHIIVVVLPKIFY